MLTHNTCTQPSRNLTIGVFLPIAMMLLPMITKAQRTSFVGDTLVPPHLFDLEYDGVLLDFELDGHGIIGLIGRSDGEGGNYVYVVRYKDLSINADTLYNQASQKFSSDLFDLDVMGESVSIGFGFHSFRHRFIVSSNNAGQTWDTVDIGDTAYYDDLRIAKPGTWLLKSSSPLVGWRYVTRDTAYWIFHNRLTESWIQVVANDSVLLFYADNGCGRGNIPDTGYFQFLRLGELANNFIPAVVSASTPAPLPPGSTCPVLQLVGYDGRRIWFKREWGISHQVTDTSAYPTELYSYNLQTGAVQFEYFIRYPRRPVRAILFAEHIFLALDSLLVFRHIDDPPSAPFTVVEGVEVGLGNLQVHEGSLYGSRSSGLIMRISQVSSVPTSEVENSGSFTTEIQGGEIAVFADSGPSSKDVRLELFDTQGRQLAESSIASGSREGRLPAPLAPGVYFLRCGGSETSTTLRIFVP